ncbi:MULTISPECIES: Hsp20/alpha crystallin family protein [Gracilibacillus]|uniref:Hsp20/alpha crystallin family protein n=1 Tax=Gracilibacillus TaxID=74385 RepID=UPI0008259EF2|nr:MULTISPECIES: Hsp20/alpha crystallin family protein [Gracilibacillus]
MSEDKRMSEWGDDLIRRLDALLYEKPKRNVMETIDQFFEQANLPRRIPVDVAETDRQILIRVDLPGLKKEQVHVQLTAPSQITIMMDYQEATESYQEEIHYLYKERRRQRKERIITLPQPIDKRTIKAKFRDGVLEISGNKIDKEYDTIEVE